MDRDKLNINKTGIPFLTIKKPMDRFNLKMMAYCMKVQRKHTRFGRVLHSLRLMRK
jgi:hypothetical protein